MMSNWQALLRTKRYQCSDKQQQKSPFSYPEKAFQFNALYGTT